MDAQEKIQKKPLWENKKFLYGVGIFFLIWIISSMTDDNKERVQQTATQPEQKTEQAVTTMSEPSTKTTQPTTPVAKPSTSAPVVQKQYQQVFTFSGNGAKKSEPFTITGDRFKIAYDCSGDLCQAFLHKVGGSLSDVVMNSVGAVKDETIIYGKGEYYLDSNAIGSFTMTVYDYK